MAGLYDERQAVGGLAADQASKSAVFDSLGSRSGQSVELLHGSLRFTLSLNPGIVFGLAAPPVVVLLATLAAVVTVIALFVSSAPRFWGLHLGLGMVLAGALGNAYDRLTMRQVRDFIDVTIPVVDYRYPVFNIADVLLVVGVGLILLHMFRHRKA